LEDGEVDQLAAILMRPGVREWWGSLDDPEHTREGLDNADAAFAIAVDGALAGWLGYNEETDPDHRHASLDIFLAPEYQGQRLGPAALRAYALVGFRPVGVMRRCERGADGRWHNNLLMDLLSDGLRGDDPPVDRGGP
jgi:aminoglycoside 6'-N-acetyltransferase